eukprot:gene8913-12021_t
MPEEATEVSSISFNSNRSITVQHEFSLQVRDRDSNLCVFCGTSDKLEADHLYEISLPNLNDEQKERFNIVGKNDIRNGITLCSDCHNVFGVSSLCYVAISIDGVYRAKIYRITVADSKKETSDKWLSLDGKEVTLPKTNWGKVNWPSDDLFKLREVKYFNKMKQMEMEKIDYCSDMYTIRGMANHLNSCK